MPCPDYKPLLAKYVDGELPADQSALVKDHLPSCESCRKTIRLLPAWPNDWDSDFKLHAPYNTTVEGRVKGGSLLELKVTPESRRKDVIVMGDSF